MAQLDKRSAFQQREMLEPKEVRQAIPRDTNFRVLIASLAIAAVLGLLLVSMFSSSTPPGMDASSGPQGTPATKSEPSTPPPTANAPQQPAGAPTNAAPENANENANPAPANEVTAPPAPPGNNPGAGSATP